MKKIIIAVSLLILVCALICVLPFPPFGVFLLDTEVRNARNACRIQAKHDRASCYLNLVLGQENPDIYWLVQQ